MRGGFLGSAFAAVLHVAIEANKALWPYPDSTSPARGFFICEGEAMLDAEVLGSAKIFNADCLKMLGGRGTPRQIDLSMHSRPALWS